MSELTDTPEPQSPPEAAAPPAPSYVTVEEFKRMEQQIAGQTELLHSLSAALTAQRTAQPAAAPRQAAATEMTDAEIDAAVDEGRMTATQAARLIAKRENERTLREHVDPLRETGLAGLSTSAKSIALGTLDDAGAPRMRYYKKYQKEIDSWVERTPAQMRTNPELWQQAHDLVVGAHMGEILEAEREAALRAANAPKPEPTAQRSTTGRAAAAAAGGKLDPVEVFGEAAMQRLDEQLARTGQTPDAWAKRRGYESFEKYTELAAKGV